MNVSKRFIHPVFSVYSRKSLIDYVFEKLKRDGPKKQNKDAPTVVVAIGKIGLTRTDLYTLADSAWLNDNVSTHWVKG